MGLAFCLTIISILFFTHSHLSWLVWLLMLYIGFFAISQGAVIWVYISEVFPNRVRAKGQSLGSSSHWVTNAIISLIFPVMAKSSGAYPFLFFAAMMVVDFFLVLFYYPETAASLSNKCSTSSASIKQAVQEQLFTIVYPSSTRRR